MNFRLSLAVLAVCGWTAAAAAQAPPVVRAQLLKDTNTEFAGDFGAANNFARVGNAVYFSASTPSTGAELFTTSGAAGDVRLVADFVPGNDSSNPRALGNAGAALIVASNTPDFQGARLWAVTPDARVLLTPVPNGFAWSQEFVRVLGQVDDRLVLQALDTRKIWTTDGTVAGTYALDDDPAFPVAGQRLGESCQLPGAVIFRAVDLLNEERLVRTDGTAAGTSVLRALGATASGSLWADRSPVVDGRCYLASRRAPGTWTLWRSDGTAGGTASIGEIETAFPVDLVTLGGDIHAAVELPGAMNAIGTFRVVRFDTAGVAPPQTVLETTALRGRGKLLATDRALLARTLSETSAAQYFLGDGTAAGTYLLNTTHPEIGDRRGALHAFGKTVLVESESMSQPGIRIDTVDGSVAPQSVTTKIWMDSVVPLGGRLIGAGQFSAQGGLWSTDATEDGTRQIAAIVPTTKDGTFVPYAPVTRPIDADGVLLFNTTVPGNPTQWSLWRSDGTEAGTWPLPAVALGGKAPYTAVAYGGEILVKARDAGPTAQLFATDAAFAHVTPLRSFYSGDLPLMRAGNAVIVDCAYAAPPVAAGLCLLSSAAAQPMPFLMLNNNEFVPVGHVGDVAIFGGSTAGIWRSDGTIAGTYRLLTEGTYPWTADQPSAIVGGRLYFRACSRGGGCSLASTDGTVAGTRIIAPMPSGDIAHIEPYGNGVAYATNLKRVWSLYVSDGTAAGTREVLTTERIASGAPSLAVVGNRIHVLASFFTPTLYLVSDGTLGGTRDVVLPSGVTLATGFVAALDDETAVFACSGPAIGEELCAVDREGTQPVVVADLRPGPLDSRPRVLGRAGDALYLVANDGIHGSEPWRVRVVGDGIFASGFETQP